MLSISSPSRPVWTCPACSTILTTRSTMARGSSRRRRRRHWLRKLRSLPRQISCG
uniref:Uncharacterized protein n=1 Tax=Rhizophora mucronata TaxID=61149 RepID=A0A2P2QR28_RHIMU